MRDYVKPELVEMIGLRAFGNCAPGSTATDDCTAGPGATSGDCRAGNTAGTICYQNGADANNACLANGNVVGS